MMGSAQGLRRAPRHRSGLRGPVLGHEDETGEVVPAQAEVVVRLAEEREPRDEVAGLVAVGPGAVVGVEPGLLRVDAGLEGPDGGDVGGLELLDGAETFDEGVGHGGLGFLPGLLERGLHGVGVLGVGDLVERDVVGGGGEREGAHGQQCGSVHVVLQRDGVESLTVSGSEPCGLGNRVDGVPFSASLVLGTNEFTLVAPPDCGVARRLVERRPGVSFRPGEPTINW